MKFLEKVIEYVIIALIVCSTVIFFYGMYDFINLILKRGLSW